MPYIVTTKRPGPMDGPGAQFVVSRVAVATLEEAATQAGDTIRKWRDAAGTRETWNASYAFLIAAEELPESGGTVGPLPDGSMIEVEPATWDDLYPEWNAADTEADVIAAFNEANRVPS